jgi:MinD superfamily P-loop ATPase
VIVAVASGKGGTGKTLIATGLAQVAARDNSTSVHLLDCDVEAPNAHLFMHPAFGPPEEVTLPVPTVDMTRCTGCGRCAEVCAFHALAVVRGKPMVFRELCHGCGSCAALCPEHAISEEPKRLGVIEMGTTSTVQVARGRLDIGEAVATPIIRALKQRAIPRGDGSALVLLDAPPGNACPVVETLRGADLALLVTEPTPFGLHDLEIAVQVARDELHIPVAVIINRDGVGDAGVDRFCAESHIPVLMRVPFDRRIAAAYSRGELWVDTVPEYAAEIRRLHRDLSSVTGGAR